MRYCSVDTETSGLSPATSVLLELAVVIEDTAESRPLHELPCWQCVIAHDNVPGEPYALALNHYLVERSRHNDDCLQPAEVIPSLTAFLRQHGDGKWTLAGKNAASFDLRFLERLPGWPTGEASLFRHRALDPAVFFWRPGEDDRLPDTRTCLERAGLPMLATHRALDDARAVVALVRVGLERWQSVAELRRINEGLAARCAGQSELLSRMAEKRAR